MYLHKINPIGSFPTRLNSIYFSCRAGVEASSCVPLVIVHAAAYAFMLVRALSQSCMTPYFIVM